MSLINQSINEHVAEIIGKIFLSNNLTLVDTLEEAQIAARELINSEKIILDEQ